MISSFTVLIALFYHISNAAAYAPGSDILKPQNTSVIKSSKYGSTLHLLSNEHSIYVNAPLLMNLTPESPYEQGFDAGYLQGNEFVANYDNLMHALFGSEWWSAAATDALDLFLDHQWSKYLSKQVPAEFLEEIRGLSAGGLEAGVELPIDVGRLATRGLTLANLPGTLSNVKYILEYEHGDAGLPDGISHEELDALFSHMRTRWSGMTCSMFGAWGSRTVEGQLFTGRNLDYLSDSGIADHKLVTVYHSTVVRAGADGGLNGEGKLLRTHAHATVGFAGIWGALTGISEKGITVHEANLESDEISFDGFPWALRLRYIMQRSSTLDEAMLLWNATNNTVGFNHGIGSAADNSFIALETMTGFTAQFGQNDPREQDCVVNGTQIGYAREEAVFRTNHGYDPYTWAHYMWNGTEYYQDSLQRYLLFPSYFDDMAAKGARIDGPAAVNITAILGHKGGDPYQCDPASYADGGSNILSVAYQPGRRLMYAAWESTDKGGQWTPAACATYLEIDMAQWFKGQQ